MEPEIRASLLKLYLVRLPLRGVEDASAVREALGPEAIRRIEWAAGHDWLPLAFELTMLRVVRARRGDEGVRALGRDMGRAAVDDAFLRPLVAAMLVMLGRRPDVLLQLSQAGWRLATRNAGSFSVVSRRDGEVRMRFDAPPELLQDSVLLLRGAGSLEALFAYGGVEARAEVEWTPGASAAVVVVSWRRGEGRSGKPG